MALHGCHENCLHPEIQLCPTRLSESTDKSIVINRHSCFLADDYVSADFPELSCVAHRVALKRRHVITMDAGPVKTRDVEHRVEMALRLLMCAESTQTVEK